MQTDKWIKTDPDLKPYFELRAELYMADGLILRIKYKELILRINTKRK